MFCIIIMLLIRRRVPPARAETMRKDSTRESQAGGTACASENDLNCDCDCDRRDYCVRERTTSSPMIFHIYVPTIIHYLICAFNKS